MEMEKVRSTMIEAIGYDDDHGTLRLDFHNGSSYEYFLVPKALHDELMSASSKGSFFLDRIQDGPYSYRCVRPRR